MEKRKEVNMNLYNILKSKSSSLWNGVKKTIDDIINDIGENFGPKIKPIKIKNNENKKRV
jgi:hypothetical protein